jgi:TPR repeat protein
VKSALALFLLSIVALHAADEFTIETAQVGAEKGDAKALYFLAKRYSKGESVPRDDVKAAQYMRQAAELGHPFAQNDLGSLYAKGLGVKQDFSEAAKWYGKAASQGDSLAQFSTGRIYSQGFPKTSRNRWRGTRRPPLKINLMPWSL